MIEENLITDSQLEEALIKQRESGGKLGEVLVGMGALDARALADALAAVLGLEVLNLRRENVDPAALALRMSPDHNWPSQFASTVSTCKWRSLSQVKTFVPFSHKRPVERFN